MIIEKFEKNGSKYKLYLDNGEIINTYDDVILNNNLLFEKKINQKVLNKINLDTEFYEIYNKVIQLINTRLRSLYEIEEYLNKNNVEKENQEKIISDLKAIGLINDYNFARAFTNDRINLSVDGPNKIKNALEKYKIDNLIIEDVLKAYSKELIDHNIKKIIIKKLNSYKKYTGYILKQKMINYLINQGYYLEDINRHLDLIVSNNDLEEMEKIYKKLLLKYKGNQLLYKLKNKLYNKGYSYSQIEEFIEKQF